jgi:hypothetical protein
MLFNGTHYSYNWKPTMIDLGINSFEIFVENYNGLKNSTLQTFTVIDTTVPEIYDISIPHEIQYRQRTFLSFNTSDLGGIKEVILQLDNGINITLQGNCNFSYSWRPSSLGNLSITIYVIDNSNNTKSLTLYFIVNEKSSNNWFWYITVFIVLGVVGITVIYKIKKNKIIKKRKEREKNRNLVIKPSKIEEPIMQNTPMTPEKPALSKNPASLEKPPSSEESSSLIVKK